MCLAYAPTIPAPTKTDSAPSVTGLNRMAHKQQRDYCEYVRGRFPEFFRHCHVLDVGSLDINGSNRDLFTNCTYTGIDIAPGKNVDVVSLAHEYDRGPESFDTIISTECFEHDKHYPATLRNIVRMLKPGGLFLFTCATEGRAEHGTSRTTPKDSPFTGGYYKNLSATDILDAIDVFNIFGEHQFSTVHTTHDLQFYGIKEGELLSCLSQSSSR